VGAVAVMAYFGCAFGIAGFFLGLLAHVRLDRAGVDKKPGD